MSKGNQQDNPKLIPGAAYIRFSSEMQNDSFSLDAQLRQIRERAAREGVYIVETFSDPATSAYSKKHRPGIKDMLDAARRREFNVLYVHKVDRLARRLEWSLEIVRELSELDINFKAVEQNFDLSTPEGKLFFHILSSLGQFYSENLSKETHKGKRERAAQGFHNGWTSWGYKSVQVGNRKKAELDPLLAPIVREMFERYASGLYSDQQIADWLNSQGRTTRKGRLFSKDTVREILTNPFYKGYVRYRGVFQKGKPYRSNEGHLEKGVHEPAISEELWDHCQAVRENRSKLVKTRVVTRKVYLLNGIIHCAHCQRRMRAQSAYQGKILYYREVSRHNGFDDCPVGGQSVRADALEEQIGTLFQAIRLPADWQSAIQQIFTESQANGGFDPRAEIKAIKEELRELREMKRRKLFDGDEHVFWREVEALQERLEALQQTPAAAVRSNANRLISIPETWGGSTREEQRELVQIVLQQVGCDLETKEITWVRPRPGFEILFQLIPALKPIAGGRFDIRDISAPTGNLSAEGQINA